MCYRQEICWELYIVSYRPFRPNFRRQKPSVSTLQLNPTTLQFYCLVFPIAFDFELDMNMSSSELTWFVETSHDFHDLFAYASSEYWIAGSKGHHDVCRVPTKNLGCKRMRLKAVIKNNTHDTANRMCLKHDILTPITIPLDVGWEKSHDNWEKFSLQCNNEFGKNRMWLCCIIIKSECPATMLVLVPDLPWYPLCMYTRLECTAQISISLKHLQAWLCSLG